MNDQTVLEHAWWLASRAAGIIALVLITSSVILGLAMSGKLAKRRPGLPRVFNAIHEQAAVTSMVAIAVHGITLLGDPFLRPGVSGITVPFAIEYRPLWTGLGIIAGYLAAVLGLSFYARKRIGARTWRKAHRFSVVVYALAVAHTIGAGSDVGTVWMRAWLYATTPVVIGLFAYRIWRSRRSTSPAAKPSPARGESRRPPVSQPATPRLAEEVS